MLKPMTHAIILILVAIIWSGTVDAVDLKINRIKIYFSNDRPEITVKRNYPLKAYVEIGYTGVGILQGHWRVDEEFLSGVTKTISSENRVIIETPDIPHLPTFVSGMHRAKFVITIPAVTIPFPLATYFVTTDEWDKYEEKISRTNGKEPLISGE